MNRRLDLSGWLRHLFAPTKPIHKKPRPTVRPLLEALENRWLPTAYIVNTTQDILGDVTGTELTLRDALTAISNQAASGNAPAGSISNTISFAIGTTGSVQTINVGSGNVAAALPAITHQVSILGFSQGGAGYNGPPLIVLNGVSAGGTANGLDFESGSSGSEVQGLVIQKFGNDGILLNGTSGNLIVGNYIGTDVNGTAKLGNTNDGVNIRSGATANTVGGTAVGSANILSANKYGVYLTGSGTSGNVVLGNRIGTDVNGTAALANGQDGIDIRSGATANTVGGTAAGAGNLISGNGDAGVEVSDPGTSGNVVLGNRIGTDVNGTAALGNSRGVAVNRAATANTVGGTALGSRNVLSGNTNTGVSLNDSGTSGNVVLGNLIGTDVSGTAALGNTNDGVLIKDATANTVGGTATGSANLISGNGHHGVYITGSGTSGNVVLGNKIGTDQSGTAKLGNAQDGVIINQGATANTVGGTASGSVNVISANNIGIYVGGSGTSGNVVAGDLIGTDINGTAALGNVLAGVAIVNGATANTVGGGNVISGNGDGVFLQNSGTSGNLVAGNLIGTDVHGTASLGNVLRGVVIAVGGPTANTIGGTTTASRNVISANGTGVSINDPGTMGNVVLGNFIGTDITGTARLGNTNDGILFLNGSQFNTVGGTTTGAANLISGNGTGVDLTGSGTSGNVVLGNLIGTDKSGTASLGNTKDGVLIQNGATANTVGGTATGAANLLSANGYYGVRLSGSGTLGNVVLGNKVGTDQTGAASLGNGHGGVFITSGATANTVGGTVPGSANLISGNANGVYLSGSGTSGNVVVGNKVGTDQTGTAKVGNSFDGVAITSGATANTVGGTATGAANVVSGNRLFGVFITGSGTSGNLVLGNKVGTDQSGTAKLGNGSDGVFIGVGATANTVGGTAAGSANLISANRNGVNLLGTSGNVVLGNLIGTDTSGTAALGNANAGVAINAGATANTVGGTATGAANVISGNATHGVYLYDSGTGGNVVLGNKIGTDVNGTAKLGNAQDGVLIAGGASANTLGGTATGAGNLISGNGDNGVELLGAGTFGNLIAGNNIGTDQSGAPVLGNAHDGVLLWQGASANTIGGSGTAANLIAGNAANAVEIKQTLAQTIANLVQGLSRPTDTLTFDAQQHPVGTVPGALTINAPSQQVNYIDITGLNLNNAQAVDAFYGPDTADRGTALPGLTADERFVQVLYLDALGRAGSKAEIDGWAALFNGQGQAQAQAAIAAGIEHSAEGRDHLVKAWYITFLGRQAQGGEEQVWVNMLLAGQTEEQVLSQILGSAEFFNRAQTLGFGDTPNGNYVRALYQLLLNRTASAGEVAGWVNAMPQIGRQGAALGFLHSQEFRTDDFEGYYNALLHRPSDAAELNGWVMSNLDGGSVRIGFETSPEFFTNG
jgi:hypothetical protein